MGGSIENPKDLEAIEAKFRALVVRFGWWNSLNTLAGMAYDAARFELPIYDQAWTQLSIALDDCARLYTRRLDRERIPDAKPPIFRDNA